MAKISRKTAEHYVWGEVCDGWHLVKNDYLSVIHEKMPPRTSEVRHYHERSTQFFFVLSGTATLEMDGQCETLGVHEGAEVPAGVPHQMMNLTDANLEFLVISQPPSHGDRILLDPRHHRTHGAPTEAALHIRPLRPDEEIPLRLLLLADPSQQMVERYVHRGQCFVAELAGQIVGEYVLLETRPLIVELANIAVLPENQGHGIGKRLVTHAIETARSMGYRTIEVGTGNSSLGQLALYQKCGFRIVGVDRDFFTRHYPEPIFENGIQCTDMVRLALDLA